jgi:uncharacterized protein YndB with AHSA1/START domain
MSQISLLIRIKASPEEVYEKITTSDGVAKWFTEASYSTDKETGELKLVLWGETDFIVTEQLPPSRIVWHCTSKDNPWFGTDITFELRAESDKTIVVFDHAGWPGISDLYRDCAMSWAYFLESLRSLIEDGAGTPEGVAPKCEASAT